MNHAIKNLIVLVLSTAFFCAHAQTKIDTNKVRKMANDKFAMCDLSSIWTTTDPSYVFGFIGDSFQRFQIHFISVSKSKQNPDEYIVKGKTRVKDNICSFRGIITVLKIDYVSESGITGIVNSDSVQVATVSTKYYFKEDSTQKYSGILKGYDTSMIFINNNYKITYFDLIGDNGGNNYFTGTWDSYDRKLHYQCKWGDYRIPNCPELTGDTGFHVEEKYYRYGWQEYMNEWAQPKESAQDKKRSRWWE